MDASTQTPSQSQAPLFTFLGSMHEGIPVSHANLDACIKFYTEVLGLKLLKRPKALDDIGRGAWLGDADDKVQFHLIATERDYKPGPGTKYSATGRHTAWLVADIEAFRKRMTALGVEYGEAKNLLGSGSAQLFVVDPEGHTWEFQEPFPKR
jgi:lactoylglutathione lyase